MEIIYTKFKTEEPLGRLQRGGKYSLGEFLFGFFFFN